MMKTKLNLFSAHNTISYKGEKIKKKILSQKIYEILDFAIFLFLKIIYLF